MPSPSKFKFAEFAFDIERETLYQNDERLSLNPKALQVLAQLLENAGSVVKKEEFFEKVWADSFVGDNNLTVAVAQIRKALGETKDAKFIETVPKKGYRFIAAVEQIFEETKPETIVESDAARGSQNSVEPVNPNKEAAENTLPATAKTDELPRRRRSDQGFFSNLSPRAIAIFTALAGAIFLVGASWRQIAAPNRSEPLKSIAVLPLRTENAQPDERIFAEKLTQDLTRNLGRVTDARVAAYEAAAAFGSPDLDLRKIAASLGVEGVITGKIKSGGDGAATELEIKINDLQTDAIVWEKRYPLNRQTLAESQYRVARDIAAEFGRKNEPQSLAATVNYEAYQEYLLARHHAGKRTTKDYEKAIEYFTAAIAKDSAFADAHAGLAIAHVLHGQNLYAAGGLSASRESFPAARRSAVRALEINPNSDEALAALAFVNYRIEYDWASAEKNFRRAVEINPNNILTHRWYGEFLHKAGRFEEGFAAQKNALALEPGSAQILNEIAWGNYLARRLDEAAEYSETARGIDQTNAAALYNASEIYEHKKDYAQAVALWRDAMIVEEANRKWIAHVEESFQKNGYSGFVRAKTDWLENLAEKDYVYPTDLAKGYAALDEKDKAVGWLEKAVAAKIPDVLSVKYAPAFDNLRAAPRFRQLLQEMNFPQ